MSRTSLRTLVITSLLLLGVLAAFSGSIYLIKHKEQVLKMQLETLAKERQQQQYYFDVEKIYEDSTEDRQLLKTHLLASEGESIDILTRIESMAPQVGVILETKNLKKVNDKESKSDWVEVAFVFSGERDDVERFVAVLEHLPYVSHLTALNLSARSSNDWEAQATLRILLFKSV
jgi:hypothetical protein